MGFAVQGPSIAEDGRNAGKDGCSDYFDAGELNGEIAHVISTFNVDLDSGLSGDSLVVPIHQVSRPYRGNGAAYSEWNKG